MVSRFLPLLFLAACATPSPPTVDVRVVCVPLKAYTPQEERELAVLVAALPPDGMLVGVMEDYAEMRAADRTCLASNKGPTK